MKRIPLACAVAACLAFCGGAAAQSVTALVSEGDEIPGIGAVTAIERVEVKDSGMWYAVVHTANPEVSQVLLHNGSVWAKVGDVAPDMIGTSGRIASFGPFGSDELDILLWIADLSGTAQAPFDSQARFNSDQNGFPTGSKVYMSSGSIGPDAIWTRYLDFQFGVAGGMARGLLAGTVHDPAHPAAERTLLASVQEMIYGYCCSGEVVAVTGDPSLIPGRFIEAIPTHVGAASASKAGKILLWSCDLDGSEIDDGCIFKWASTLPDTLIAREGWSSPVPGRLWGSLEDASVDASTQFQWTLRAHLDASDPDNDGILLRNGQVFVREGDVVPASAPHPIADLGRASAPISQDGRVYWYASWDTPDGKAEAILVEDLPVLRTGATAVGTALLVDLDEGPLGFAIAGKGRYLVAQGTLDDGRQTLLRVDLGGTTSYCTAKTNSLGCSPQLSWSGVPSSTSTACGFDLVASKLIAQSLGSFIYGLDGPQAVPFHGGTLCVKPPLTRVPPAPTGGLPSNCSGQLILNFNAWAAFGGDPSLVAGASVYLQAWYRDPGFAPPDDVGLTKALEFFLLP